MVVQTQGGPGAGAGEVHTQERPRCRGRGDPDSGRPRVRGRGGLDPGRSRCRDSGGPDPGRPRYRSWGGSDSGQLQVHGKEISRPWLGPVIGVRDAQVQVRPRLGYCGCQGPGEAQWKPRCCSEVYFIHRGGPGPGAEAAVRLLQKHPWARSSLDASGVGIDGGRASTLTL